MRVLIACLLLVSAGLPLAQSSRDLRSRFGQPDVERYTATNEIGLTVEYGSEWSGLTFIEPKTAASSQ